MPPMDIIVDESKWQRKENRLPPRVQSITKQDEIHRQTTDLILNKVLEPTQEAYYSQVLLTPKPNGKWRFCIDFRRLNLATEELSWPLPNIPHLLRRIGGQKTKIFWGYGPYIRVPSNCTIHKFPKSTQPLLLSWECLIG